MYRFYGEFACFFLQKPTRAATNAQLTTPPGGGKHPTGHLTDAVIDLKLAPQVAGTKPAPPRLPLPIAPKPGRSVSCRHGDPQRTERSHPFIAVRSPEWPKHASGAIGGTASKTLACSPRKALEANELGASIAVRASNWIRWLGIMSRSAPVRS